MEDDTWTLSSWQTEHFSECKGTDPFLPSYTLASSVSSNLSSHSTSYLLPSNRVVGPEHIESPRYCDYRLYSWSVLTPIGILD